MFTCFEILPESEGIISRICEKIMPPKPQREFVQVRGATPFLRLIVKENHVDWRKISSSLLNEERHILLPQTLDVPQGLQLDEKIPTSLGLHMMFSVFMKVLSKQNATASLSVSIFDKNAKLSRVIEKIVPFVRNVSVYTENVRDYFYVSSQIMSEWGLSIKIYEYESICKPSDIILADSYLPCMKKSKLVFVGTNKDVYFNTVTGWGISFENDIKELKSFLIDDFSFASFLYEYNKAKFLEERDFLKLNLAGRPTDTEQLADIIENGEIT